MSVATTAEVAAELRCTPRKVRNEAKRLRVGFNLGGRAGWRFSPAEVEALKAAMRPAEPEPTRRRIRRR